MALIRASGNGHVEIVRLLLQRGADARKTDREGARALDMAAQEGRQEVVDLLLAHDPGLLDLPGYHQRTALAAAAGNGHGALVSALLARGADPRRRLAAGTRALDWAAARGYQDVVERLLAHDAQLLDLPGYCDATALMAAAWEGQPPLVTLLLARGADPLARDADGDCVLDGVVHNQHWAVLEVLLAAAPAVWDLRLNAQFVAPGADAFAPGVRVSGDACVLEVLILRRHTAVAQGLLERHPGRRDLPGMRGATALMLAAAAAQPELVRWLLAQGVDAAACDARGDHALMYAVEQRAVECARALVEHDARLMYRRGARGRRPVTEVAQMSRTPALRELFEAHGASLAGPGSWRAGASALQACG